MTGCPVKSELSASRSYWSCAAPRYRRSSSGRKPSNVLLFDGDESKLGDLGRAAAQGYEPPHEDSYIAGDQTYAPPELLYHHMDPEWSRRRLVLADAEFP